MFENFAAEITALQEECTLQWKKNQLQLTQKDFLKLVEENHAFNYQLWHAEDRARRDDKGADFVYQAKREIDQFNQQRNNRMEAMDEWLFTHLNPVTVDTCPLHSETPGMIIDRLSILALKAYHMDLQVHRDDVDTQHHQNCHAKLQVILQQKMHLQACLQQLIHAIQTKTRTFKVYHQFKMYNDPTLNPELY